MMSRVILIITLLSLLQGCAAVIVGAGAVGVKAATDRRTIGTQLDDQALEVKVSNRIGDAPELEGARVEVVAYNEAILLVGQVPSDALRAEAERLAREVRGIDKVFNQLRVGSAIGIGTITADSWITSKVKTRLLSEDQIDGSQIKVVTENGEVFLLGLVKPGEAQRAIDITRNINGVKQVINALTVDRDLD